MKNSYTKKWAETRQVFDSQTINLGPLNTYLIHNMPRQLLFKYSRYKFCAKMIGEDPRVKILELGCSEGLGTLLLAEHGHEVTAIDFDRDAIEWAKSHLGKKRNVTFKQDDFLGKTYGQYDAVVALDVIEHIPEKLEKNFLEAIVANLHKDGFCIIGTPNITASKYQSEPSKAGHINLFNAQRLKGLVRKYFNNVFLFGMNDEVVHTGFSPMCNYLIVLGCGKKG